MASNQGQRSVSSRGIPALILATFAGEWKLSPSANGTPRSVARAAPTVDFPHPETPMTTTTGGVAACRPSIYPS
jgi:hypothetical protein